MHKWQSWFSFASPLLSGHSYVEGEGVGFGVCAVTARVIVFFYSCSRLSFYVWWKVELRPVPSCIVQVYICDHATRVGQHHHWTFCLTGSSVTQLKAIDPEDELLMYGISGEEAMRYFSVTPETGVVWLRQQLDREVKAPNTHTSSTLTHTLTHYLRLIF